MINNKKLHFWQLFAIFASITLITLVFNWAHSNGETNGTDMMGSSMASMMGTMHLENIQVSDLFQNNSMAQAGEMKNSYNGTFVSFIHLITTSVVIILLPLIMAGAVFLAIMWIKI